MVVTTAARLQFGGGLFYSILPTFGTKRAVFHGRRQRKKDTWGIDTQHSQTASYGGYGGAPQGVRAFLIPGRIFFAAGATQKKMRPSIPVRPLHLDGRHRPAVPPKGLLAVSCSRRLSGPSSFTFIIMQYFITTSILSIGARAFLGRVPFMSRRGHFHAASSVRVGQSVLFGSVSRAMDFAGRAHRIYSRVGVSVHVWRGHGAAAVRLHPAQ